MTYQLIHGDARHVSGLVAPGSVDLLITSPPYFSLRSYQDGGEHYDGQIGSEPTPTEFLDALIACTRDWLTVMRPTGSIWVNLGDKYAGSGGHNNGGITKEHSVKIARGEDSGIARAQDAITATRRSAPDRYNQSSDGIPAKSLMGLPWRYAIRCIDELGLILRAEVIWSKPNGLPESVTDRVRRSHEQWFHFSLQPRYFAAVDEIREPHEGTTKPQAPRAMTSGKGLTHRQGGTDGASLNPLGKLPGSVWTVPTEPLQVPDHLGVDHFAAFPSEWPRRLILGWSPSGYCTACDQPRRPVVDKELEHVNYTTHAKTESGRHLGANSRQSSVIARQSATITGYACDCPTPDAPTRPAVVLDPFLGTGTTVAVAHHLGRHGIGTDLSRDYLRLAEWRCSSDTALRDKVLNRSGITRPADPVIRGQMDLFGGAA